MIFYNDNDPKICAWLSELIRQGLLPVGEVLCDSISNIKPVTLGGFRQAHFFAGIGGWPLALAMAGWPEDLEVWTGSCPCQPFSQAGQGKAEDDDRHLWPAFAHLIAERRPPVVFGEQVESRLGREWLSRVRADLEALGYAVGAADLCAAGVSSPHKRQRLFWGAVNVEGAGLLADWVPDAQRNASESWRLAGESAEGDGATGQGAPVEPRRPSDVAVGLEEPSRIGGSPGISESQQRQKGKSEESYHDGCRGNAWSEYIILDCLDGKQRRLAPGLTPLAHGVPARVVRLRGYGNAIVPQVAAAFVRSFTEAVRS